MKKTFLEWLKESHQIEDISKAEPKDLAQYNAGYFDYLGGLLENKATLKEDEIKELLAAQAETTKEMQKQYMAMFAKQGEAIDQFIQGANTPTVKAAFAGKLDKAIDIAKEIKEKGTTGEFSLMKVTKEDLLAIKATVTTGSVTNNTDAFRIPEIGQLAYRLMVLYDFFQKFPVGENSNGTVRYTDWNDATKVRAAAAVAEGAVFPESTAQWEEYSETLKKTGDSIKVTEESIIDRARFVAELDRFLDTNVSLVIDQGLYDGDGVGQNLLGVYTTAPTYTPPASGITDANIFDLLRKTRSFISQGKRSKYMPNVAMMNVQDIDRMLLKKDANNNYVRPDFFQISSEATNMYIVSGILIIETNTVTPNTMLVGDSRFAAIYEESGFDILMGMDSDDFSRDLRTLKARKRLLMLVRTIDRDAWAKITDISAALVLLAT